MASFAAGAMGATSFESELVTDEPGSKADPIKSAKAETCVKTVAYSILFS